MSPLKTIHTVSVESYDNYRSDLLVFYNTKLLNITIEGDAFLYNQIRRMMGVLYWAGKGKIEPSDVPNIIAARDSTRAQLIAPAQGLFLKEIFY